MINWLKNSRRTATRGRFIPWQFDCDPKVPFVTVRGPDGFSLVVQVEDFTNLFRAFMTNYGHLQWPVTMAGFFNPPIQVANAIELAFAEILVRMTPEGYCQVNAQQSEERSLLDMSFEVSLGTVCFFGGDRILQEIADEAAKDAWADNSGAAWFCNHLTQGAFVARIVAHLSAGCPISQLFMASRRLTSPTRAFTKDRSILALCCMAGLMLMLLAL